MLELLRGQWYLSFKNNRNYYQLKEGGMKHGSLFLLAGGVLCSALAI